MRWCYSFVTDFYATEEDGRKCRRPASFAGMKGTASNGDLHMFIINLLSAFVKNKDTGMCDPRGTRMEQGASQSAH